MFGGGKETPAGKAGGGGEERPWPATGSPLCTQGEEGPPGTRLEWAGKSADTGVH